MTSSQDRMRQIGRPSHLFALLLALLAVVALLAACGGSADSPATAARATIPVTGGASPASSTSPSNPSATATMAQPSVTATMAQPSVTATMATTTPDTSSPPAGATSSPSVSPLGETLTLNVYFLRDENIATAHRVVPKTLQVAAAAMTELLKGPTEKEQAAGFSTAIPRGTQYISTAIEGTTATVNLSGEFASGDGSLSSKARLAQVVYTLTQFPTVDSVQFAIDGQVVNVFGGDGLVLDRPQTRADFEDLTPAILVESPAAGEQVSGDTLRISGTANTFEATFSARVVDANGATLAEQTVTATSGSGTRGTFDVTLALAPTDATQGTLTVFEPSAKDGTPQNVVEIPLAFGP